MARTDGLDACQVAIIRSVLAPFAAKIERVCVFGSRATGAWRVNSDLDLVIFGSLRPSEIDRLWTLFDDSALDLTVDVLSYDETMYPPLRAHIDAAAQPLFAKDDLLVERA